MFRLLHRFCRKPNGIWGLARLKPKLWSSPKGRAQARRDAILKYVNPDSISAYEEQLGAARAQVEAVSRPSIAEAAMTVLAEIAADWPLLSPEEVAELYHAGVMPRAMAEPFPLGSARVKFDGDRFDLAADGERALVCPSRPRRVSRPRRLGARIWAARVPSRARCRARRRERYLQSRALFRRRRTATFTGRRSLGSRPVAKASCCSISSAHKSCATVAASCSTTRSLRSASSERFNRASSS